MLLCSRLIFVGISRVHIDELRQLVGAGDEDDLVLLRYILSKGSAAKAVSAIHFARRWRSDPENRFYLELVRAQYYVTASCPQPQ
jgi:hypothetical protein